MYDFLDNSPNRCGIYSIELFVNSELIYFFKTDEFSFSESRYINSHTDYSLRIDEKKHVHRLFKLPNNSLSMEKFDLNEGVIKFETGKKYSIKILIEDVTGNKSELDFEVQGGPPSSKIIEGTNKKNILKWDEENLISNHIFKFSIPKGGLYEDAEINYSRTQNTNSEHEFIHKIGDPRIPLHSSADLYISTNGIEKELLSKICIISIDEENVKNYIGGIVDDEGWMKVKIREFGNFTIDIDTIAPEIQKLKSTTSLKFMVKDDLSGIAKYEGFIDNNWALFEYDPKKDLISYYYDKDRLKMGVNHEIELYVTDNKGNTALLHSSFFW